jgi:hypothetical protein
MKNFLWFTGIYVMSVLGIFIVSALIHSQPTPSKAQSPAKAFLVENMA